MIPLSPARNLILLMICGLSAMLTQACLDSPATEITPPKSLPVAVTSLARIDSYSRDTLFSGRVEARRDSLLGFELAGRVDRVAVDEGDRVGKGDILAELDTARLQARRAEIAAGLAQIQAVRDLAQKTHVRVAQAAALNAVSDLELDQAADQLRARDAELARLKAQLEIIDVDLEKSRLRAPFAGEIIARHLDEGEVVQPGGPVVQLLEQDNLEVRIGLSSQAAAGLTADKPFEMEIAGASQPARFKTLLAGRDARTRTVTALFTLNDSNARQGDLAHLKLKHKVSMDGFKLPRAALTESIRGLWSCYVLQPVENENGAFTLARREVMVQHDDGEHVFVTGLLKQGDRVVRAGSQKLVPGIRVTPQTEVAQ